MQRLGPGRVEAGDGVVAGGRRSSWHGEVGGNDLIGRREGGDEGDPYPVEWALTDCVRLVMGWLLIRQRW